VRFEGPWLDRRAGYRGNPSTGTTFAIYFADPVAQAVGIVVADDAAVGTNRSLRVLMFFDQLVTDAANGLDEALGGARLRVGPMIVAREGWRDGVFVPIESPSVLPTIPRVGFERVINDALGRRKLLVDRHGHELEAADVVGRFEVWGSSSVAQLLYETVFTLRMADGKRPTDLFLYER